MPQHSPPEPFLKPAPAARPWPSLTLALLVLLVPVIGWGAEMVAGQVPAWGATYLQFQPWWTAVGESYRAGRLPLWNPQAGFGSPLAANPQAAAFSPFALLTLLVPAERALALSLLAHCLIAAWGAYAAARRLGIAPVPALLAGLVFPFSGALASWAVFPPYYATASWLPLAVAAWPRAMDSRAGWRVAATALILAVAWLDGHPQAWLIVVGGGVITMLATAPWQAAPFGDVPSTATRLAGLPSGWARALALLALPPVLALLLAAFQAVPAFELLQHSSRSAGLGGRLAESLDPPPAGLLLGLAPTLFGSPERGDYRAPVPFWEWSWYAGALPLLLAVFGARQRSARPALVVTAVGLTLAFLPGLPLAGGLGRLLAGGDYLRGAGRWLLLADFGLCLLSAAGFAALLSAERPEQTRRFFRRALAVCVGLLAGGLIGAPLGGAPLAQAGMLLGLAAAVSLVTMSGHLPGRAAVPLFFCATALELLHFARPLLPLSAPDVYANQTRRVGTILVADGPFLQHFSWAFPLDRYARQGPDPVTILPNRGSALGYRDALAYDPLRLASNDAAISLALAGGTPTHLARLGITNALTSTDGAGMTAIPNVRSRLSLVTRVDIAKDRDDALRRLFEVSKPDDSVLLTARPPRPPEEGEPVTGPPFLRLIEDRPERLLIETSSAQPAFLRVLDSAYPGWVATVDGRFTPILEADGLFRAVGLSAGRHVVLLEYRPGSLVTGAAVSLATLAGLALLLARGGLGARNTRE